MTRQRGQTGSRHKPDERMRCRACRAESWPCRAFIAARAVADRTGHGRLTVIYPENPARPWAKPDPVAA